MERGRTLERRTLLPPPKKGNCLRSYRRWCELSRCGDVSPGASLNRRAARLAFPVGSVWTDTFSEAGEAGPHTTAWPVEDIRNLMRNRSWQGGSTTAAS